MKSAEGFKLPDPAVPKAASSPLLAPVTEAKKAPFDFAGASRSQVSVARGGSGVTHHTALPDP